MKAAMLSAILAPLKLADYTIVIDGESDSVTVTINDGAQTVTLTAEDDGGDE